MAARRLVIVMLVLLGLSTLAAALLPRPDRSGSDPAGNTGASGAQASAPPPAGSPASAPPPGLVNARITVSKHRPPVVRVHPGNRLVLLVGGPFGDDISIPAFGLTQTMAPSAPARFDLIVNRAGRFGVRAFGAERVIGTIVSRARGG